MRRSKMVNDEGAAALAGEGMLSDNCKNMLINLGVLCSSAPPYTWQLTVYEKSIDNQLVLYIIYIYI